MTRFAAGANQTAVTAAHVPYRVFVALDFVSGFVRLNSGDRDYSFGGFTYQAIGMLGAISSVKESADNAPDKLELQLSGVDNSLITTTLTEKYHGRSAVLYVGFVNEAGDLVATPHTLWEGRMDTMTIRTEAGSSVISLVCENRLVTWDESAGWLYTHEHQGLLAGIAGDNFFDQVQATMDKTVKWGGSFVGTGGGGGGGGAGGGHRTVPV